MAPIQLECTVAGCNVGDGTKYKTPLLEADVAVTVLGFHRHDIHGAGQPAQTPQQVKAKMEPPKIQLGVDQQTWDHFMARWAMFKTTMGVDGTQSSMWFFNCLDRDLGDEVLKANPGRPPQDITEADLVSCTMKLAVKVGRCERLFTPLVCTKVVQIFQQWSMAGSSVRECPPHLQANIIHTVNAFCR